MVGVDAVRVALERSREETPATELVALTASERGALGRAVDLDSGFARACGAMAEDASVAVAAAGKVSETFGELVAGCNAGRIAEEWD